MLTRRRALAALGGSVVALAACGRDPRNTLTGPGGVRDAALAFNVQPLGGGGEALQRQALRLLGLPWIRTTLGLVTDTQARPYTRAAPNVVGLVADFQPGQPTRRRA
ncbi:MAG: hypothetical protein HY002_22835 [Candidatus Rokubacteria bacterium]|nr:hypothetical protein [Candidatus Rokubacteria bacterium]